MHSPLKTTLKRAAAIYLLAGGLVFGCKPEPPHPPPQKTSLPIKISDADFNKIQSILSSSCMPCHNRRTLPEVIARTEKGKFKAIGDDTRLRILGELGELKDYMEGGLSISFTSKEELHKFFESTAGEFYLMLEKGLMPPPWAVGLTQEIKWPLYQKLSAENRLELMKYSKPYTERYLR